MGLEIFAIDCSSQNHDLFQNEKCKLFVGDQFLNMFDAFDFLKILTGKLDCCPDTIIFFNMGV